MRKISYTTFRRVRQLHKSGKTKPQIVQIVKISGTTVSRIIDSTGWVAYQKTYYGKVQEKDSKRSIAAKKAWEARRKKTFWQKIKSFFTK